MGLGHQTAHIEVSQGEIFRAFQHQIEPWLLDIGASKQPKCLSREDEVGNEKSTRGKLIIGTQKTDDVQLWAEQPWNDMVISWNILKILGAMTHGQKKPRIQNPYTCPHSSCQFSVTSYITAILSLHTFIYVIRSYLSQDRTSNNCSKPSSGRIFRNTILRPN